MADIELVVKMPEWQYKTIKENKMGISTGITINALGAIQQGIPLPKGHGKIIDESVITEVYAYKTEPKEVNGIQIYPRIEIIGTNAPTIIEADKEQE